MDLPREDELRQTYRSASDNELLEIALTYDSLTEVAQNALRAEFARRELEPPVMPDPAPEAEPLPVVTVQQYRDLTEAQLAMGVLESAGIPCYLRDENTVRVQWLWSNLMGGIRLQVREEDRAAAEALLHQPIPEQIQADGGMPYDPSRCPRCDSLDIHMQFVDKSTLLGSIPASEMPDPAPTRAWKCGSCGAFWLDPSDHRQS
jgi:hypothetical protein